MRIRIRSRDLVPVGAGWISERRELRRRTALWACETCAWRSQVRRNLLHATRPSQRRAVGEGLQRFPRPPADADGAARRAFRRDSGWLLSRQNRLYVLMADVVEGASFPVKPGGSRRQARTWLHRATAWLRGPIALSHQRPSRGGRLPS
jgi:hypothetical protein